MGYSVCVSKLAMYEKFQALKNVHRDSREALAADVVDEVTRPELQWVAKCEDSLPISSTT